MTQFEVGKWYKPYGEYHSIKILKRTSKTIWVDNTETTWMMRIKHDAFGNEFAVDSSVPKSWQEVLTYDSRYIDKQKGEEQ